MIYNLAFFILAIVVILFFFLGSKSSGLRSKLESSTRFGKVFDYIKRWLAAWGQAQAAQQAEWDRSKAAATGSTKPLNDTTVSRRNLKTWWIIIGLVIAAGAAAFAIDMSNKSDMDTLSGSNDSAVLILIASFIVLAFLGIGARFSYLKYSRVDQADLIASVIKSHVQEPKPDTLTVPANPSPQNSMTAEARLRKLASLLADGLISNDDYETKKKQIIDSI